MIVHTFPVSLLSGLATVNVVYFSLRCRVHQGVASGEGAVFVLAPLYLQRLDLQLDGLFVGVGGSSRYRRGDGDRDLVRWATSCCVRSDNRNCR